MGVQWVYIFKFLVMQSTKSARISTRINPELKAEVESILSSLGLSASDAIDMLYHQISMHRGLPFEAKVPNKETIEALNEDLSEAPCFDSVEALMDDLNN